MTIRECIATKSELEIKVRTITGDVRTFSYMPCFLETDDSSLICYLAGLSHELGAKGRYSIYAVRLQRIVSAVNLKRPCRMTDEQIEKVRHRIETLGIAYIGMPPRSTVRMALTENGYQKYLKLMLHQRPLPCIPVEMSEGNYPYVLTFGCSTYQIMNYFFPFGSDAMVLEPDELRTEFAEKYRKAAEMYKE